MRSPFSLRIVQILPFLGQMMMDYCERVMDLSLPERASPLTQAAIREIRADLREKLTVETLAETLHCSRSSLSHTFSREMKMSVSNYITICKIEEAPAQAGTSHLRNSARTGIQFTDSFSECIPQGHRDDPGEFSKTSE